MTAYGAFVELEEGIDGMIHVSDLSLDAQDQPPAEVLQEGRRSRSRCHRHRQDQPAHQPRHQAARATIRGRTSTAKYKIGDLVKGKVTKLASFGAFVQLEDDIDGLVHISQISEERVDKIKDVLKVGQEVEARVIKVDKAERRIGLSIKAANYSEEELKREAEAFDTLRPGEDMVGLEQAFAAAEEEYRPGEGKK